MTGQVVSLWRHPIKSHGRESLDQVTFEAGKTMPGDRVWAVLHEAAKADGTAWAEYFNFCIVGRNPALMAISARYDEANAQVTLTHPDLEPLSFNPDRENERYLDWVAPLIPEGRAQPKRIVRVPGRGMTDTNYPSVTLCNLSSHRAVEQRLGQKLSQHRWRGNIWMDDLAPWEEFDWVGREVQIGEAVFDVRERAERCAATKANPETGIRDADTLGALEHWGHQDFSVYAVVVKGGLIRPGDAVKAL